eukprot:IDg801t1
MPAKKEMQFGYSGTCDISPLLASLIDSGHRLLGLGCVLPVAVAFAFASARVVFVLASSSCLRRPCVVCVLARAVQSVSISRSRRWHLATPGTRDHLRLASACNSRGDLVLTVEVSAGGVVVRNTSVYY